MIKGFVLAMSLIHSSGEAWATNCPSVEVIIERVEEREPRLDGVAARLDGAEAQLAAARSERLPAISAYTRTGTGDGVLQSNLNDNEIGIQLSQELFSFGATTYNIRAAKAMRDSHKFAIEVFRKDLKNQVSELYFDYRASTDILAVRQDEAAFLEMEVAALKGRLAQESITEPEADQARAVYAMALASVEEARGHVIRHQTALEYMADVSLDCAPRDRLFAMDDEGSTAFIPSDEEVRSRLENHPEVKQAEADLAAARLRVKEVERRVLPRIALTAFEAQAYDDVADQWNDRSRVGINVSQDLFRGAAAKSARAQANAERRQALAESQFLHRALSQRAFAAQKQLASEHNAVHALTRASVSLERQLAGRRQQFEADALPLKDLIDAAREYFDTEERRILTLRGYQVLSQELAILLGE